MRLDHLLSKEKIIVKFVLSLGGCLVRCLVGGKFFVIARCWLASGGGKFLFSGESKSYTRFARVGGSVKQSGASSFFRGFGRCVCVLVLMVCFVFMACCWVSGATRFVVL